MSTSVRSSHSRDTMRSGRVEKFFWRKFISRKIILKEKITHDTLETRVTHFNRNCGIVGGELQHFFRLQISQTMNAREVGVDEERNKMWKRKETIFFSLLWNSLFFLRFHRLFWLCRAESQHSRSAGERTGRWSERVSEPERLLWENGNILEKKKMLANINSGEISHSTW